MTLSYGGLFELNRETLADLCIWKEFKLELPVDILVVVMSKCSRQCDDLNPKYFERIIRSV